MARKSVDSNPRQPVLSRLRNLRENDLLWSLMTGLFRAQQAAGLSITPNHYYWPIPDLQSLAAREWPTNSVPPGFDLGLERQLDLLRRVFSQYRQEWLFPDRALEENGYHYNNGFFEAVDAEVAYSFVRHWKPRRIIEIGGGFSTRIMNAALHANHKYVAGELITIDPTRNGFPAAQISRSSPVAFRMCLSIPSFRYKKATSCSSIPAMLWAWEAM